MRTRFQLGLDELREKLLKMGGMAEQAVDRACQAYRERDLTLCHRVRPGRLFLCGRWRPLGLSDRAQFST